MKPFYFLLILLFDLGHSLLEYRTGQQNSHSSRFQDHYRLKKPVKPVKSSIFKGYSPLVIRNDTESYSDETPPEPPRSRSRISPRVIGGHYVVPGELPYHVQITYKDRFLCSGALVRSPSGPVIVLTTAECVTYPAPNNTIRFLTHFTIIGGALHILFRLEHEQRRSVRRIIRHPQWNRDMYTHDIAIIQLHYPFVQNEYIKPLPMGPPPGDGSTFTVAGWGYFSPGGNRLSDDLHGIDIKSVSYPQCTKMYEPWGFTVLKGITLCLYDGTGQTGPCKGDEGTAAVTTGGDKKVVGIMYFVPDRGTTAQGCGTHKYPSLFVSLEAVRPWIEENSNPYLPEQ